MSRILRNSRIGMIETGSAKKYFLYALGETILIVLGVLIALSINNANGKRKQEQKLKNIYSVIAEDIKNDTTELAEIIKFYDVRKEFYDKVLSGELSLEELKACENCKGLAVNYEIFIPELTGYHLLRDFGGETGKDSLMLHTIRAFANVEKYATHIETVVSRDVYGLLEYWRDTQSWYNNFLNRKEDEAYWEYIAHSNDYKNRLAHHHMLIYGNYVPRMSSFKADLGDLLSKISILIGEDEDK